jgi:hypothetical protein
MLTAFAAQPRFAVFAVCVNEDTGRSSRWLVRHTMTLGFAHAVGNEVDRYADGVNIEAVNSLGQMELDAARRQRDAAGDLDDLLPF